MTGIFKDRDDIDWSDPGGWFCLLNMIVLLLLTFLCLVALARINKCTMKLVKRLDRVAIEVPDAQALLFKLSASH